VPGDQRAELVAAQAVRLGACGHRRHQVAREPAQQRVAGGVPVRVVVVLEAVEVEEGDQCLAPVLENNLEIAHEFRAVAQLCEVVGQRGPLGDAQQIGTGPVGQHQPPHGGHDRGSREQDAEGSSGTKWS
jgi:hypothetical protein